MKRIERKDMLRLRKIFSNIAVLRILLLAAGAAMLLLGIFRDEVQTVLMKAVYICLECIGIG